VRGNGTVVGQDGHVGDPTAKWSRNRNANEPAGGAASREGGGGGGHDGGHGSGASYEELFHGQFAAMTRLAAVLGADDPEDVAQEAFVRLHGRTRTLRDPHAAIGYLRTTVVNLTRSRLRHLAVVRRHPPDRPRDAASAEHDVVRREGDRELLAAVHRLSPRHREALVLRYWLDLGEAEMADAMGVSRGTVKSHVSRGLDALAALMEGTR
jgi:RNA polymerase sigma-70 factor (sigma-E family)